MSVAGAPASRLTAGFGVALASFSAAVFGFGTTFAFLAYEGGSNPLTVVLLRTAAFVVVVGAILAMLGRIRRPSRRALTGTLWMAVMLIMVAIGYQGSVAYIPVSLAALVFYSFPLLVGLIAVASRRDRMTLGKGAALLAAFVGLGLALGPGFEVLDWRGIALALVAAVGMALTMTFGGEATRDEDALLMSVITNFLMLIALAVFVAAGGGLALPVTRLGTFSTVGLCLTYVVAYVCWFLALGLVRPVRLGALFNIEPLVTLVVAWLVLGERLSAVQLFGAALVLVAILGMTLSRATRPG